MHTIQSMRLMLICSLVGCATQAAPPPASAATAIARAPESAQMAPPAEKPAVTTVAIPNARQPLPGVVTGGKPSEENLQQAKELGYHSVISLLPEAETGDEAERARALGLDFVSIPVAGPDDLTEANARQLANAMDDPASRPLVLHCASGNRAGALLALRAFYVDHQPAATALALGVAAGMTTLRGHVAAQIGAQ